MINFTVTRYLPVIFFHCVLRDAGREEELDTMSLGQTMIRKMSLLLVKVWSKFADITVHLRVTEWLH